MSPAQVAPAPPAVDGSALPTPPPGLAGQRVFWLTFLVIGALAVAPIWSIRYLPMVDLPQHAAQVSIWQHWQDPSYGYQHTYEAHWFTPYLLAYTLARILAIAVPVLVAFKLILSVAVVALPLVLLLLLRDGGGDPWWSFLAFPVAFGYSFYWGFVNYVLATPLVLLFWYAALVFARRPSLARGVGLALFAHFLFFAHALLFAFAIGSSALLLLARRPPVRAAFWQLLTLVSAAPLAWVWLARVRGTQEMTHNPTLWQLGWERFPAFGGLALGEDLSIVSAVTLVAFFALPLLCGGRPAREPERWVPFACSLGAYLLVPLEFLGTAFLYPRFAVFVVPAYLAALRWEPARSPVRRWRFLAPLLAAALLLSLTLRFQGFQREVGDLDQVLSEMEPGRRALSFVFDRSSEYVTGPVFLHFGTWYQSQRGGIADFSFASFFAAVFQYPPDLKPPLPGLFEWRPQLFRWDRHGGDLYDYFLVRSGRDVSGLVFKAARPRVELEIQRGPWWLYRRVADLDGDAGRTLLAGTPLNEPRSAHAGGSSGGLSNAVEAP